MCRSLTALLLVSAYLLSACHATSAQPELVGRSTKEGQGYPYGHTDPLHSMTIHRVAASPTYGYSENEPILLGGDALQSGPERSRRYLNSLRGPHGEEITYEREGSCCMFETENSELGAGLLDRYALTYEGLAEPLLIYINMYDGGELFIPQGLTAVP